MREPVHTIDDYYDGPKQGIADFEGKPHYYEREFDKEEDEYSRVFRLTSISESIFELAMEKWQIWCRWRKAFDSGKATISAHPALAEERPRYDELKRIVDEHIANSRTRSLRARAGFVFEPPKEGGGLENVHVEWARMGDGTPSP